MANGKKVSIQLIGYANEAEAVAAVSMVRAQRFSGTLECNFCDPDNLLEEVDIRKSLEEAGISEPVRFLRQKEDAFGVLSAGGDYIVLCLAGYRWVDADKLEKQLRAFDESGCTLVTHDVELVKEDGYPCDQTVRNRYIKQMGYEDRRYGLAQLQRFSSPGLTGTWMFRNLFREPSQQALFLKSGLDAALRILTMLICQGHGVNLADDRMVVCQRDEQAYQSRYFPKYGADGIAEKRAEWEDFRCLASAYGITPDPAYRMIYIANGAFNALADSEPTEAFVSLFMETYQEAYRESYDEEEGGASAEKSFFRYLRSKMQKYELNRGTEVTLPLSVCFAHQQDRFRADSLAICSKKRKRALYQVILGQAEDPQAVLETIRSRKKGRIRKWLGKKGKAFRRKCRGVFKRLMMRYLRKRGFSSYMSNEWFETVWKNLFRDHDTPLKTKLWCYRRGFLPWRIEQYGLTAENFPEFLSDRDYMYLHQINNSYKKWIEDKMTLRYVLEPFRKHLPAYYFQILQRDDRQLIVKLPDCPEGYDAAFDELFRLLREKGKLAFKSASGTHGAGFYKVEFRDGQYYLNNNAVSEHALRKTIDKFKSFYIVTEYVNMHDQIKALYDGAVNTIRIMTLNRDGHHPQIMDAYMRIGSVKSGVTDNVAYGGVVCSIDVETGEYGNGLQIVNHVFVPIENHPDTGTALRGTIPHWETIQQGLKNICAHIPQLEYLGFDVVCTPEGFTILEINSHQDLHRYPYYDQQIKDFYFYKLRRKERRYHIKRITK